MPNNHPTKKSRRSVREVALPGVSQLPSGAWRVRVSDPLGRTHHLGTYETQAEANLEAMKERAAMAEADWVPPKARRAAEQARKAAQVIESAKPRKRKPSSPPLGEYLDQWIERKSLTVKPTTTRNYRTLASIYVRKPILVQGEPVVLADVPLDAITGVMLTRWVEAVALTIRGRSQGCDGLMNAKHCFTMLRAALNSAVREDLLTANPASKAEVITPNALEREPATPAQVQALATPCHRTCR